MISPLELQRLRDLPIEGVAQRLGIQVSHGRFLCPAHTDHTPSASISRKNPGHWKCWSCGAGGNAIDLTMHVLNKDFREACEWLGARDPLPSSPRGGANSHHSQSTSDTYYKSPPPGEDGRGSASDTYYKSPPPGEDGRGSMSRYARFFEHPYLSESARHFLFDVRHLDPRVISWCRVTSWQDREGVNWLQIPYFDMDGKLIGVQNRNLGSPSRPPQEGGDLSRPIRFMFAKGSTTSIYNLPVLRLLKPQEECWIAEGSSDCWSLLSDHHKAIAIASATLLQPSNKELLQRVTAELSVQWKMAPDQDEPGLRLAAQLQTILPKLQIVSLPEGCKDYSDFYVLHHDGAFAHELLA